MVMKEPMEFINDEKFSSLTSFRQVPELDLALRSNQ